MFARNVYHFRTEFILDSEQTPWLFHKQSKEVIVTSFIIVGAVAVVAMPPKARAGKKASKETTARGKRAEKRKVAAAEEAAPKKKTKKRLPTKKPTEDTDSDEEEVVPPEERKEKAKRPPNFIEEEDIYLCKAHVNVSQDGAKATDQTIEQFWQRIYDLWSPLQQDCAACKAAKLPKRDWRAMQSRFSRRIRPAINRYNGYYKALKDSNPSGWNEEKFHTETCDKFLEDTGKPFGWSKCVPMLLQGFNDTQEFSLRGGVSCLRIIKLSAIERNWSSFL